MTPRQKHLLWATLGVLLLALTFFREGMFVQSTAGVWLYRLAAVAGLVLLAGGLGRLLLGRRGWWAGLALLLLGEIGLAVLFRLSVWGVGLPGPVSSLLSYIYLHRHRDYIVYHHERGRWDEELFYTLRPGEFGYDNLEFSTTYQVNDLGLRDDRQSLRQPEIIFLGDSYTMGWGVEQHENFPQLIEQATGRRTLTAGIASYGTARQYLTWQRLPTDSCRLLVLQFCPNDVRENRAFVENDFRLPTSPAAAFEQEVVWNQLFRVYYPLKYVHSGLYFLVEKLKPQPPAPPVAAGVPPGGVSPPGVEDFFAILQKFREGGYGGPIVIFHLGMGVTQPGVTQQWEKWLAERPLPGVHVFPTADHLSAADYLPLDTHLTRQGNRRLARALLAFLRQRNLLAVPHQE